MKFSLVSAIFLACTLYHVPLGAQNNIEPPEIKEALNKISSELRDSLKFYQDAPQYAVSIKRAKVLDSLTSLYLTPIKLTELFRSFNKAYENLPYALKPTLKGATRKKWLFYQTISAISGGIWAPTLLDGVEVPKIFPDARSVGNDRNRVSREVGSKIWDFRNKVAQQPIQTICSFPLNGAYNVYTEEWNGTVWGYQFLSKPPQNLETGNGRQSFVARWTCSNGSVIYSYAEWDNMQICFNFIVPTRNFISEQVYRMEVVTMGDYQGYQNYWKASCFGGTTFFKKDYQSIVPEWAGIGAAMAGSIYFRVSKYASAYHKLSTIKGTFDPLNFSYNMPLDEPMDSSELYGTAFFPPRLQVHDNLESDNQAMILRPVVSNYFNIPRTTKPVDVDDYKTPHPYEQAHLYNKPFFMKLDDKQEALSSSIVHDKESGLLNGYKIPSDGGSQAMISQTGGVVPFITSAHFANPKLLKPMASTLSVKSGKAKGMERQYLEVQRLLAKRIQERAVFFYKMEVRHCKQTGVACTKTQADFDKMEQENLPPTIKNILNTPFGIKQLAKGGDLFYLSYRFPGGNTEGSWSIKHQL